MPLYEYQCDECGHTFEKIQKFSDPLETVCPKCGGPVRKLMSSPAIQFKGTGWYVTDYAKKDQVAPSKSGDQKSSDQKSGDQKSGEKSTSETKAEAKTETKTESKPETKSETKSST
jgi:putative FmdB family regulatory protein